MHRLARVDLGDLGRLLDWLLAQWWSYVIIAVVVLFLLWLFLSPAARIKASPDHPSTGDEANEIALGILQILNDPSGLWNDPTAGLLSARDRDRLAEQWGLVDRASWQANIARLVDGRRRREEWTLFFGVRAGLAARLGRAPKSKEWIAALVEAGASKKEARDFADNVEFLEDQVRKTAGRKRIPADVRITSFDGYAFGQAVAVATWGVALGLVDVAEAREAIHEVNAVARPCFGSWEEFGMSYTAGRVMHWSDGELTSKSFDQLGRRTALDMGRALTGSRGGPWAELPWRI